MSVDPVRVADAVIRIAPAALEWVRDRLEAGESEDDIRRDILDRRVQVAELRRRRDEDFEAKFGPLDESD